MASPDSGSEEVELPGVDEDLDLACLARVGRGIHTRDEAVLGVGSSRLELLQRILPDVGGELAGVLSPPGLWERDDINPSLSPGARDYAVP
jgi:hypothetical protein